MAKIINFTPHLEQTSRIKSPVYAVVSIPLVKKAPVAISKKRSLPKAVVWFLDVAVSLGLGAMMLVFLLILLVSL